VADDDFESPDDLESAVPAADEDDDEDDDDRDEEEAPPPPDLPLDDQDRVHLVLCYLGILALVPFLTARKEFVLWHARQGLLLFGLSIICLFGMILVNVVLWAFHWVVGLLFLILLLTSGFGFLALMVACILKAFSGERFRVPFVGDFVERL
jgi:uncharacterized membrane protein